MDPTLTSFSNTPTQSVGSGTTSQSVNAALTGLSTGTTYYYRVAASNSSGTTKGSILSFVLGADPTVTTSAATGITTSGATLNGSVNPNGLSTSAWFKWGTNPSLTSFSETAHQLKGSGTTNQTVSSTLTTLTSWCTYYFRVVASSTAGTQEGAIRSFPTGEYYVAVGDSITFGDGDDIPGDDTSLDGRNTGGGYEPILNNLLTAAKGYPHTVVNVSVDGATSADGAVQISTTLSNHPSAKYYLVLYGTNDALFPAVPSGLGLKPGDVGYSGSYKDNMQTMISAILAAGKTPYLAKVPYTLDSMTDILRIQDYNRVVDELIFDNLIMVIPPDLYTYFQSNPSKLSSDGIHPNGAGYQSMANLWFTALTTP
jgi:lysophospholipase L1-like esterase